MFHAVGSQPLTPKSIPGNATSRVYENKFLWFFLGGGGIARLEGQLKHAYRLDEQKTYGTKHLLQLRWMIGYTYGITLNAKDFWTLVGFEQFDSLMRNYMQVQ